MTITTARQTYSIKDYASRQFTYYTTDVKTDNSGAGTEQDPKCVDRLGPQRREPAEQVWRQRRR